MASKAGSLAGRHAVVTGGSRGIGAAVARVLADEGATLTVMGRDEARLDAFAADLPRARAVVCDVADAATVPAAFAQAESIHGPVHILVNNAGSAGAAPFERIRLEEFRRLLDVNLIGTFLCTQAALPGMKAAGWGRVVNIASTAALKGYAYVAAYCAAKHGVLGLTRALALELARSGVTVNAVCPGYTDTDLVAAAVDNVAARTGRDADTARAEFIKVNPQGRLVRPAEVAAAVLGFCGANSDALTGQALSVSGGEIMT